MSGGTFNHSEYTLLNIADQLGENLSPYEGGGSELPKSAALLERTLREMHELLREIDRHYANDSDLSDDAAWAKQASARLRSAIDPPA